MLINLDCRNKIFLRIDFCCFVLLIFYLIDAAIKEAANKAYLLSIKFQ